MDTQAVFANPVKEESTEKAPKSQLIALLDEVGRHVDILRRDLLLLEARKDTVLSTLDTIRHSDLLSQLSNEETAEVELYAERLTKLCSGMDVKITTTRDLRQEEALYEVNRGLNFYRIVSYYLKEYHLFNEILL
ncbi:hypothetical protein J437_LFUL012403 [Ladona fulva]|uniref:Uncharacterized protein n=1 Tax=Ladona fulva TaxID=123851 RepID=A0A8K0PBK7_LADFU|nr:hypothetical protein J437_LFUL012403 [Ladona fulva]